MCTTASRPAGTGVCHPDDIVLSPDLWLTRTLAALHFHLTLSNSSPDGGNSYDDAEFTYLPFLDADRDGDLLQILPDYLTEEICFPRSNAAKFYSRIVDCMTKKVVIEDAEPAA